MLTLIDSNEIATIKVKIQLVSPAQLIALGLGPCRKSSAPIIIGTGPENKRSNESYLHRSILFKYTAKLNIEFAERGFV